MDPKDINMLYDLFGEENVVLFDEVHKMEGTVTRMVETKGFGFITGEDKMDYFFHRSDFSGFWEDLEIDFKKKRTIKVTFDPSETSKGLRASHVSRVDGGV